MNFLFTFETISAALDCEFFFKGLKTACTVIPVPRKLESSCTYAIVAQADDISGLCAALREKGAVYKKVFRCAGTNFEEITYQ
ncbi:hypothetical protein FACS189494_03380 [Spirochaetia bacterium]|nr:hypothetical protein FACS189494_03380 [Spirochaetia bacterium]